METTTPTKEIDLPLEQQIDFLVGVVKSYQWLMLSLERHAKFNPSMKRDMQVVKNVEERLQRYMKAYHEKTGRQYHPAVNEANRNNGKL